MSRNRKQDAPKGKPPSPRAGAVVRLPANRIEILPAGPDLGDMYLNIGRGMIQKAFEIRGLEFSEGPLQRAVDAYCLPSINHLYCVLAEGNKSPSEVFFAAFGQDYPKPEVISLFDENQKPGYTRGTTLDETGGTVGDAREYFALAAKAVEKAFENGLSVADLDEAIEDKLAAKIGATARETTSRAMGEPRPPETAPVAEREPPHLAQQRTAQELFGMSASTPARRYHKSDGPEFCEAELADRVLLAAAEATRNEMKTRAKTEILTTEERARWQRAGRFVYHARKIQF
jgi:hypothetical protein